MKLKAGQFFGKTERRLAVNGVSLIEKAYPGKKKIPAHAHELAHFCLVLEGSFEEGIGRSSFDRRPSSLAYYPAEIEHTENHATDGRHLMVEIAASTLERLREYDLVPNQPVTLTNRRSFLLAAQLYTEFRKPDRFSGLALECLINELLIESVRSPGGGDRRSAPRWLAEVKEYLDGQPGTRISLDDLAAIAGVHPTHLARTFRRFANCTVGEYLRRVRVERARQLLSSTDTAISAIALDLGFSDQPHFTRVFQLRTGFTPNQYRRQAAKGR